MQIEKIGDTIFESIKHVDEAGREYWLARELYKVLKYTEYTKFVPVINKAIKTCENSNNNINDHFAHVSEMINLGKNAKRKINDYKLSRYACYLIAMNGDSRKEVIALAQTYFAVKTRLQEISEKEYSELTEDEKRLYRRKQVKESNKSLNKIASIKGVKNFDKFTNAGYKGLYNGETANDIAKRKGLRYREDILDNMGSVELGANIFRITQTDDLLNKQVEKSEKIATDTHYMVGLKVRKAIKEIGGTMPENLPTPSKSLTEIDKYKEKPIDKK